MKGLIMRREWLLSVGAVGLAFLGTQHHNLMMLLLAFGLTNVGMSLMTKLPLLRDTMLVMSLGIAALICLSDFAAKTPAVRARHWRTLDSGHDWARCLVSPTLWYVRSMP
jgi:hypothetical protein